MRLPKKAADPLEFAVMAARQIQARPNSGYNRDDADRYLRKIAVDFARQQNFKKAFELCEEIGCKLWLNKTLMEIACEMLAAGKEDAALQTIDIAWRDARSKLEGFPEADLFQYFDVISSFGQDRIIRSILICALTRLDFIEEGEFRFNCLEHLIPSLAKHWREKAEEMIDHVLAMPSGIPGSCTEFLSPDSEILLEIARLISKHDLGWSDERQERLHKVLEYNQLLTIPRPEKSDFNLIDAVEKLIETRSPVRIGLTDFQVFLAASNGTLSIGKARASGKENDRAADAMEMALSRLLPALGDFQNVSSAAVLVSGSLGAITVEEYQTAMDILHELIPEDAHMLASIVDDEALGENIEVTVLLGLGEILAQDITDGARNDNSDL
jgi:hypothetical protein